MLNYLADIKSVLLTSPEFAVTQTSDCDLDENQDYWTHLTLTSLPLFTSQSRPDKAFKRKSKRLSTVLLAFKIMLQTGITRNRVKFIPTYCRNFFIC